MEKILAVIILAFGAIGMFVLISFLLSWPVYMLWNGCLVGAVEGVNEVTWMQAWGLSFLFGILFKNSTSSTSSSK
jgi:hypothetical protein